MSSLLAALLGALLHNFYQALRRHFREVTELNLKVRPRRRKMAKIGDTFTARINPTDDAGNSGPVTSVVFTADPDGVYTVAPGTDGLSAVYTAAAAGTGVVARVSAVSAGGVTLRDMAALPDVEVVVPPPVEVTKLNLTVS